MKQNIVLSMVLLFSCLAVSAGHAEDGLQLGTEFYFFNYEEPNFMEDEGMFYGVNAAYTKHFTMSARRMTDPGYKYMEQEPPTFIRVDGRFAYGQVDYESVGTGTIDDIDDYVLEGRGVFGYDFLVFDMSKFTPYIGIGYRYLNDDTGGKISSTGAAGYERESNYVYVPVGFDFNTLFSNDWAVNFNLEFDIFVYGRQKSHLGDAIAGLNTVENDQDEGIGARGSIKITKKSDTYDYFIEPFARYWKVDDSDTATVTYGGVAVGYGLEPENETLEAGAKFGVHF